MYRLAVLTALTLVSLSAQTISFEPARSFGLDTPALAGPTCLAAGDFNSDGKVDLIAANSSSDNLSFLAGNGDGAFRAPAAILVGAQSAPLTVQPDRCLVGTDLNKDGRLDVAVVSGDSDRILVLFGNGDGTFREPVVLHAGVQSYFIAAADFNGDGIPDLIAAATIRVDTPFPRPTNPSGIAVLLSRGDGTFQAPKIIATAALAETLAIGDVDRDGRLDLVGTSGGGYTSVFSFWRGHGDGTFQPPIDRPFGTPGFAYTLADVNRDGNLDVLATTTGGVLVFPGNGDGTFRAFVKTPSPLFLPAIKVADLNLDGWPDIVVSYNENGPAVQLGNGKGSFGVPISLGFPGGDVRLEIADFNGDGFPDLAFANGSAIGIYVGRKDGRFDQTAKFGTTGGIYGLWPGDWNGDGATDLIGYGADGTGSAIFEGDGGGNFRAAGQLDPAVSAIVAVADLNSDGKTDLIVQLAPNEIGVSLSQGNNYFGPPRSAFRFPWQGPSGTGPRILRIFVCDLNRDGKPDLVISYGMNYPVTTLMVGNGDGAFTESASSPLTFAIWAVADFNRDAIPDLLDAAGHVWFGRGEGTFRAADSLSGSPCSYPSVVDVDGDGAADVVCDEEGSWGALWAAIYRGDGNGGFYLLPSQQGLAWQTGQGLQVADFDGDRIPDALLFPNIYLGDGKGSFTLAAILPKSGNNISLAPLILDVNRDGKPDLLIPNGPIGSRYFSTTAAARRSEQEERAAGVDELSSARNNPRVT